MMKLEKYVNKRYKSQIEKIDGIVHTTENTIFDLLCQQLDQLDEELQAIKARKRDKFDIHEAKREHRDKIQSRYERFATIANIFFESNLQVSINSSIDLLRKFF